jgi:DegV family protein with EDD domain
MAGVRVVTDSACDLPKELADQLGIEIVPLTIRFGSEEYTDRLTITAAEFYEKLRTTADLPETAAPSPGAYEEAFNRLADDGADGIVCACLSSGLSATMQSAENAARAVGDRITVRVIDSRSITMGLGTQVVEAARAAAAGRGLDDVAGVVEDLIPRTRVHGVLDTLEFLKKGGRIGSAQAMLGTLLSIKPVLDLSTGVVEAESRQRTRGKALRHLAEMVTRHGAITHVAVMHGDAPDVDAFLDLLAPHYPRDDIHVGLIGATIGTHGGPGIIGVTYVVPD